MTNFETSVVLGTAAGAANVAGGLLLVRRRPSDATLGHLIGFGAGFMISATLLEVVPRALTNSTARAAALVLTGYVLVHLLERTVLPHAHLSAEMPEHKAISARTGYSVLSGLAIHTFFDGVAISSGFVLSTWLGWIIFLAVVLHKVPEGLTAASFMLSARRGNYAALAATVLLALTTIAGTLLIGLMPELVRYGLPLAAGVTLYVAASGLVPEINRQPGLRSTAFFLLGIGLFLLVRSFVDQ